MMTIVAWTIFGLISCLFAGILGTHCYKQTIRARSDCSES